LYLKAAMLGQPDFKHVLLQEHDTTAGEE